MEINQEKLFYKENKTSQTGTSQSSSSSNNGNNTKEQNYLGKKIFFVNPSIEVERKVIETLIEREYEVYIIRDFRDVKGVLKKYPDSICLINADKMPSLNELFNFVKSFSGDPVLSTSKLGIYSSRAGLAEKNNFLSNLDLPCGFLLTNELLGHFSKVIFDTLDQFNAKGRRQYLRLDASSLDNVMGYISTGDKMYSFKIDNISSVGFACTCKGDLSSILTKNSLMNEVTLMLGRKSLTCSAVVFDARIKIDGKLSAVLLFTKATGVETRQEIKNFVVDTLQAQIDQVIISVPTDLLDYTEQYHQ
ncbi:MAG: hypothetical protein MJ188_08255 [Treponema sp.]|nr:hypothetical protein [Treponema sp.]